MKTLSTLVLGAATTAVALGLASGIAWAGPGQHPTPADCAAPPAGTPCVVVSGTSDHANTPVRTDTVVGYTFTLANSGDSDGGAADVALHLDKDLQLDRSSVEVNGKHVRVIDAGGVPDIADPFLVPAHGSATVTFSATVLMPLDGPPHPLTSYVVVSGVQSSDDVVVSPPAFDFAIANSFSTPTNLVVGNPVAGAAIELAVTNRGTARTRSVVTAPIPSGWSVEAVDTSDVRCATMGTNEVCSVAAFPQTTARLVDLVLTPGPRVAVGGQVPFTARVAPVGGVDGFPDDNSVTFQLRNAGAADLHVSITQNATKVLRHGLVHFTVTVTNRGPNAATMPGAVLLVRTGTDNGFTQLEPVGPGEITEGGGDLGLQAGPSYDWSPGTIPAGRTVRLQVTWRAEVLGATGHLETRVFEQPYDASARGAAFQTVPSQPVTVVSVLPPTGRGSGTGGTTAGSGSELAATGFGSTLPLGWGAGLVAVGSVLLLLGRRRTRA